VVEGLLPKKLKEFLKELLKKPLSKNKLEVDEECQENHTMMYKSNFNQLQLKIKTNVYK